MQLTVTTGGDDIFPIDVSEDLELENFKALLEFESGIAAKEITIYHDGKLLEGEKQSVGSLGIKSGDVLLMVKKAPLQPRPMQQQRPATAQGGKPTVPAIDWGTIQVPPNGSRPRPPSSRPAAQPSQRNAEDPANIRELFLNNPHQLSLLKERNPRLAEALLSGNLEQFAKVLEEQRKENTERVSNRIRMVAGNPFDPEVQRQISEEIRMENVNSNMETAMEFQPESFGQVFMLYINCTVNGHPVKAFVDSGAQMTIMSAKCADRCAVTRLIDHRWAGTAIGVGTQKIIGRIHLCQIQIENDFLPTSFAVLEDQQMDILLGLDMLKRHQCCIDLRRNILQIGTTGTETSFLAEADLPSSARLNSQAGTTSPQPMQQEEDRMLAEAMAKSAEEANKNKS
eukprot:Seg414.1 transcript_id=Seg414.1/GoldUCD/mRNA.D3Y31 product="Protein DDI1 2" protein_id=Seg414.1/GoldUCD/D3Y31